MLYGAIIKNFPAGKQCDFNVEIMSKQLRHLYPHCFNADMMLCVCWIVVVGLTLFSCEIACHYK